MLARIVTNIIPGMLMTLLMFVYVAMIIYILWLATRFVRAIEKIANKFGNVRPPT